MTRPIIFTRILARNGWLAVAGGLLAMGGACGAFAANNGLNTPPTAQFFVAPEATMVVVAGRASDDTPALKTGFGGGAGLAMGLRYNNGLLWALTTGYEFYAASGDQNGTSWREQWVPFTFRVGYEWGWGKFTLTPMVESGAVYRVMDGIITPLVGEIDQPVIPDPQSRRYHALTPLVAGGLGAGWALGNMTLTLAAKVGYLFGGDYLIKYDPRFGDKDSDSLTFATISAGAQFNF